MGSWDRWKAAAADEWAAYVDHDFVRQLGAGTLPEPAFRTYLVQDYLFLIQFARAYALATYKSRTLADMRAAQAGVAALPSGTGRPVRPSAPGGGGPAPCGGAPGAAGRVGGGRVATVGRWAALSAPPRAFSPASWVSRSWAGAGWALTAWRVLFDVARSARAALS